MKYVSFSLWGDKPIYNIGAIRNSELVSKIYSDWKMILYHDNSVPPSTLDILKNNGVLLEDVSHLNINKGMWRFLASDLEDCEYVIFRDCDSRISIREKLAVDEWIISKKSLHVMRDHPYHRIPAGIKTMGILAGMWGLKGGIIPVKDMINKFPQSMNMSYGIDQTFLKNIYFIFSDDMIVHDEFFGGKSFPIKREHCRFIGERIDENEEPSTQDWKLVC
jgi:hypothetical protein